MFRFRLPAVAALAVLSMFILAPRTASAGAVTYHLDQTVSWTADGCGFTFSGLLHEQQESSLNPNGQLDFHYIANGHGDGVNGSGETASVELNNKGLDHIISAISEVEINRQFNVRIVGQGQGRLLENHWVFESNETGLQVDSVTFVVRGCP